MAPLGNHPAKLRVKSTPSSEAGSTIFGAKATNTPEEGRYNDAAQPKPDKERASPTGPLAEDGEEIDAHHGTDLQKSSPTAPISLPSEA